ncbi:MAG: GGDEF domain-containing protein [Candidatus Moraniibacteriota bacterium]
MFNPWRVIRRLLAQNAKLRAENRVLRKRSEYDPVTGGRNRHGLERAVTLALKTLASQHLVEDTNTMPLLPLPSLAFVVSMLFVDLDHFKELNDAQGHTKGDKALKEAQGIIDSCFRDISGLTGRWGGDEFVIVLPCADQDVAHARAEKVRQLIEKKFQVDGGITASIGVSSALFRIGENPRDFLPGLVSVCDQAMYEAKRSGKNRVYRLPCANSFDRRR